MQVARHVGEFGQGLQFPDELLSIARQLLGVGILEAVLVLGPADDVLHRDVLDGLHVEGDPGNLVQFGLEAPDDLHRRNPAHFQGLQVDLDAAAVEGRVGSINPDEGGKAFYGGILEDDGGHLLLEPGHFREGDALVSLGDTLDLTGVLRREESLRHDGKKDACQDKGCDCGDQGQTLMAEYPFESLAIKPDCRLESPLGSLVEFALVLWLLVAKELRAEHRRQGQGNHCRDEDCDAKRDREFPEEPSGDVAHEQERDQDGDQRDRERHDREADLLGALQRRLQGLLALLDVAGNVLDHDDRVVHDEPGRNRERHQREVVQAVAQDIHDGEGPHEGEGDGDAGDDRSCRCPQEEEDDGDDEGDAKHQLKLHVADGRADRRRPVREDRDVNRGGDGETQARQQPLDPVHDINDVRTRLPLDIDDDGGNFVHPGRLLDILDAVHDVGDILQEDRSPVAVGDDHLLVVGARGDLVVRVDLVVLLHPVKAALGGVEARGREGRADILEAHTVVGQLNGVDLDPDGGLLAAADRDGSYPGQLGNLLGQPRVRVILDLGQGNRVGSEREGQDRRIGRVDLVVDRGRRQT